MAKYIFKDYTDYENQRDNAMENAKKLASEGNTEAFAAAKAEIEAMDAAWDEKTELDADMAALDGNKRIVKMEDIAGVPVKNAVATGKVALGVPL